MTQCKGHHGYRTNHFSMSHGAVTFLYTGDANSVQKHTAPFDIEK